MERTPNQKDIKSKSKVGKRQDGISLRLKSAAREPGCRETVAAPGPDAAGVKRHRSDLTGGLRARARLDVGLGLGSTIGAVPGARAASARAGPGCRRQCPPSPSHRHGDRRRDRDRRRDSDAGRGNEKIESTGRDGRAHAIVVDSVTVRVCKG